MTYDEAMERFGHDAPDLRFGLELVDCTDLAAKSDFRVFSSVAKSGGKVRAINAKKGGEFYSRRGIDALTEFVGGHGAKGLAWFKVEADGTLASTIAKNFTPELLKELATRLQAEPGDLLLFVADQWKVTCKALLRAAVPDRRGDEALRREGDALLLGRRVSDVRLRRRGKTLGGDAPSVHVAPRPGLCDARIRPRQVPREGLRPGDQRLRSGRRHDPNPRRRRSSSKVFNLLGIDEETAQERFGFLLEALALRRSAARRHRAGHRPLRDALRRAGQHPRLHRLPQDAEGDRPDDRRPSPVEAKQLKELGIKLDL